MDAEKLIEKLSQERQESLEVIRIAVQYAQFVQLVQKMRTAQIEERCTYNTKIFDTEASLVRHRRCLKKRDELETMVDNHIKSLNA